MGTSLTPEFWELFAILLVLATGLTCVLVVVFDDLVVRLLGRRTTRKLPLEQHQQVRKHRHTSAHC
ncbi:hypothetical protein ACIO93_01450 [Streptomyces sp. NPDC087903]|uniref:hypothetical protein n=1 Tax=Streptomyces sp. NPDC087903 TaxID=3365819 RepID=UPI003805BE41